MRGGEAERVNVSSDFFDSLIVCLKSWVFQCTYSLYHTLTWLAAGWQRGCVESRAAIQKMENSCWSSVKCLARVVAEHPGGEWAQLCRQSVVLLSGLFPCSPRISSGIHSRRGQRFQDGHSSGPCCSVLHWERQRSLGEIMRLRKGVYNSRHESHGQEGYGESKLRFLRVFSTLTRPSYLRVRLRLIVPG